MSKRSFLFLFLVSLFSSTLFSQSQEDSSLDKKKKELALELGQETEKLEEEEIKTDQTFNGELAQKYYLEGKKLFGEKKYQEAQSALMKALLEDPNNISINYLLGKSAYNSGDYDSAIMAYERALEMDSNHQLSRLEKARAHTQMGEYEKARMEFERSLESELPPILRQNVELLIAQLSAQQRNIFSGALMVGYNYDSNATLGTGPFDLSLSEDIIISVDPTNRSDDILNAALILNHDFNLWKKRLFWKSNALLFGSEYNHENELDLRLLQGRTGLAYNFKTLMLQGMFQWMFIEKDSEKYQNNLGFYGKASYFFNPKITYRLEYSYLHRHYFQTDSKNGLLNQLKGVVSWIPNDRNILELAYTYAFDKSPSSGEPTSFYRNSVGILYTRILNPRLNLSLGGMRRSDNYRNSMTVGMDTVMRSDTAFLVTAAGTFKILPTLLLQANYRYTDNDSNVVYGRYSAYQVGANITWLF